MKEIDIIEMVCDWHARSVQYGTNLMEFVTVRQENRFKFPQEMYEKIYREEGKAFRKRSCQHCHSGIHGN